MNMKPRIVLGAAALAAASSGALANITFNESYLVEASSAGPGDVFLPLLTSYSPEGGEPEAHSVTNGVALDGDTFYSFDGPDFAARGLGGDTLQAFFFQNAARHFSVGDLPVLATGAFAVDARVSNLSTYDGIADLRVLFDSFIERDTDGIPFNEEVIASSTARGGPGVLIEPGESMEFTTAGVAFSGVELDANSDYFLHAVFAGLLETDRFGTPRRGGSPDGSVLALFEAGGLSDYDGLSATLTVEKVPTPGSITLLALASLGILRRRR